MKSKEDHSKQSFKLDDFDKKVIYAVPENYFDELPSIIQSRVTKSKKSSTPILSWSVGFKCALPVVTMIVVIFYLVIGLEKKKVDVQALLEEVSTEELISYLDESDLSTEELLSMLDLNEFDVDGMVNDEIELLNDEEWDELLEEYPDFENEIE